MKSTVLLSGSITDMVEDKKGNIWTHNREIIYAFKPSGKVDIVKINDDTTNATASDILSFCKDENDNIWILTRLNFYKYDHYHKKCILWLSLPQSGNWVTNTIYDSVKKGIWFVIEREMLFVDVKSKKIM